MRPTYMLFHLTLGKRYIKGLKPHDPKLRNYSFSRPFAAILKIKMNFSTRYDIRDVYCLYGSFNEWNPC